MTSSHRNRRMRFTLGAGAADLELESFQGAIRLEPRGGPGMGRAREKSTEQKKDQERTKDENPDGENKE